MGSKTVHPKVAKVGGLQIVLQTTRGRGVLSFSHHFSIYGGDILIGNMI